MFIFEVPMTKMTPTRRKVLTLVLLREGTKVLLGMKKRGFGVGKWNGFGGKVEAGETVVEAAAREVNEECGLTVETCDLGEIFILQSQGEEFKLRKKKEIGKVFV